MTAEEFVRRVEHDRVPVYLTADGAVRGLAPYDAGRKRTDANGNVTFAYGLFDRLPLAGSDYADVACLAGEGFGPVPPRLAGLRDRLVACTRRTAL